jgi:uncharacterized membrane protein YtjA (UPF0391 family)
MLKWTILCLFAGVAFVLAAILAGLLGLSWIAGVATNIAWILFGVGVILALVLFFRGRKTPQT